MKRSAALAFVVVSPLLLGVFTPAVGEDKKADTAPYVKLPETKKVSPNRYFCLKADTNCPSVKWIVPSGLDQLDPEIQIKDPLAIVLIGDAGTYTVQCYGALNSVASDIASCTVTIGTPPPPTPPTPPDPLTAALQAGYSLDTDSDRAASLAFLQQAYVAMAAAAPTWTTVKTNQQAVDAMKSVVQSASGLTATKVANLRKAIAAQYAAKFGTTGTTPIALSDLSSWLSSIGVALKGVK